MGGQRQYGPIELLGQTGRILVLFLYSAIAWLIYFGATGLLLPSGSGASVWLLAAIAYWLLTLLAAPYFLPPKDSLSTAIAAILLLVPMDLTTAYLSSNLQTLLWLTVAISVAVVIAALVAIFHQVKRTPFSRACYRLSGAFGKGEVLFTPAVIISAIGFYHADAFWMYLILGFWTLALTARPVETVLQVVIYLSRTNLLTTESLSIGTILRIDDPGLVRLSLTSGSSKWDPNVVHLACLPNGERSFVLPLFTQMANEGMVAIGICCEMGDGFGVELPAITEGEVVPIADTALAGRLGGALCGEASPHQLVGVVVEGSSIEKLRFRVTNRTALEEGLVVFALIRGQKVYFQILDASTNEEIFHANPLGVHLVSAAQLGSYDTDSGFEKFPWLPEMNQAVFLASAESVAQQTVEPGDFIVGQVPSTGLSVPVNLRDLVEYHAAILGITGTGKTELSLDIIRNAVKRGTKVFCVDFTGEYKVRLSDLNPIPIGITISQGSELETLLFAVETGEYSAKPEKIALKAFLDKSKHPLPPKLRSSSRTMREAACSL